MPRYRVHLAAPSGLGLEPKTVEVDTKDANEAATSALLQEQTELKLTAAQMWVDGELEDQVAMKHWVHNNGYRVGLVEIL
jgi:hypothetical protein